MKGIMFNTEYGLEQAVLNGTKTRTWRADKEPRYKIGEIVAIKQCYCSIYDENKDFLGSRDILINEIFTSVGWRNKMFVKNELMLHKVKITGIKQCRLQDITGEECLREGIFWHNSKYSCLSGYSFGNSGCFSTPLLAFRSLINKLNGKGYWESNPLGYAYEFELVK
jgi:uncharacterized protein YqfB (UPF0267 family)